MPGIKRLTTRLQKLKNAGFVKSLRKGSTGIGYTLETLLEIPENRSRDPDFGKYELKAKRRSSGANSSLFVPNWTIVGGLTWKEVVREHGHRWPVKEDKPLKGKNILQTIKYDNPNKRGWVYTLTEDQLQLKKDDTLVAYSPLTDVETLYYNKFVHMVWVIADSKKDDDGEYFHYNEAYLLEDTSFEMFLNQMRGTSNPIVIDMRIGITLNDKFDSHGNALRASQKAVFDLYDEVTRII